MPGIFRSMFDLNRDGKLSAMEQAMELQFLEDLCRDEDDEDDEDDYEEEDDDKYSELDLAGLDPEELEYMDEYERREVLEEAGLNPDEFDF